MKRLAVFCDGTWNSPTIAELTHVRKAYDRMKAVEAPGQLAAYFPGIGTVGTYDGPVKRFFTRWGGGAFGWGLDGKVKEAYEFICNAHKFNPGEEIEIYLFGFSRGAFTARSVAGLIRKAGIVRDTSPEGINRAFALYRKRGDANRPDEKHIMEERIAISDHATSPKEQQARGDGTPLVNIAYLGVWDTVGARGIPVAVLGPVAALWNRRYLFHDMELSSLVRSARHAVAVDEQRKLYKPALWSNLDGPEGRNAGRDDDPLRPYQQVWFVGNHGIVGGSGKTQDLAGFAMAWVMGGAGRLAGTDTDDLTPDALADSDELIPNAGWIKRWLLGWRDGPGKPHELHDSVRARWDGRPDYRPGSLGRIMGRG